MFKWATFREILLPSSGNVNDYVGLDGLDEETSLEVQPYSK